jgi:hypothetical protein
MQDIFWEQFGIFIALILLYVLLSKTIFREIFSTSEGYNNAYAVILTAFIMTTFECLFVFANYYFGLNNSANRKIKKIGKEIATNYKQNNPDVKISIFNKTGEDIDNVSSSFIKPFVILERKKIKTINTFVNLAMFMLILVLLLILLYIRTFNDAFTIEKSSIWIAIVTTVCLSVFFLFFYFNVSLQYKMIPDKFDLMNYLDKSLHEDENIKNKEFKDVNRPFNTKFFNKAFLIILGLLIIVYVVEFIKKKRNPPTETTQQEAL